MTGIRHWIAAVFVVGTSLVLGVSLTFADDVSGIQLGSSLETIDHTEARRLAQQVRSAFKSAKFGTVRLALQHRAAPRVADTMAEEPVVAQDETPRNASAKVSKQATVASKVAKRRRVRTKRMEKATGDNQVAGSLLDDAARLAKQPEARGSGEADPTRQREHARARVGKQNRGAKRLHALPHAASKRRKGGKTAAGASGSGYRGGAAGAAGPGATGPGATGPGAAGTGTGAQKTGAGKGQRR